MVLNREAFMLESNILNIYSSPVGYLNEDAFDQAIWKL